MSAILSPCGTYRYRLERTVGMTGPVYAFFGVNPSTADAAVDDATVRKWTGFTKLWGGSRFIVGNAFPLRATDVRTLATCHDHTGESTVHARHLQAIAREADVLVPCWGDTGKVPKELRPRFTHLLLCLQGMGKPVMCFGLTKGGDPLHPLMLPYRTPLVPLESSK